MDKSLDDIIRERKTSKPSNFQNRLGRGRGRGGGTTGGASGRGGAGGNRGGRAPQGNPRGNPRGSQRGNQRGNLRGQNRGRGTWQKQPIQFQEKPAIVVDARQKLIQKAHQGDARDRLAKKARQTDARLKLTTRKRSADGQVVGQPRSGEQLQQQPPPPPPAQARPLARTVPNLGSTFTVRNPARVQNKTQITIRNPPQQAPSSSSLSLTTSHGTSPRQSNNPLMAGSSTLRVTKAVPQPPKRPTVIDYPHFDDDLLSARQPNPPKVQRRMPESVMTQNRAWASASGFSARLHAPTPPPGTRLIISNLQISVTVDDIKELFGAIGELTKTRMVRPGLAEVVYVSRTDAIQAISTYHNRELDGKPMLCKLDTSTIPEASGNRTMPNSLSNRFKTMRPENNPKLPFESKGAVPAGIDPGVVQKALFKKGATPSAQKPVVFTVKI